MDEKKSLPSACEILVDEYADDEEFQKAIISTIESALKSCPIGSHRKQAKFIADYIFSK